MAIESIVVTILPSCQNGKILDSRNVALDLILAEFSENNLKVILILFRLPFASPGR